MSEQTAEKGVIAYHPDLEINAEIIEQSIEAERIDLAVGYPPRAWTCPCGATHNRGHLMTVGTHRCLSCGYVGTEGVMHGSGPGGAHKTTADLVVSPPEPYSDLDDQDDDCGCAVSHPRWCAWNGPCCDNCSHGAEEAHADCCGVTTPPGATS